MNSSKDINKNLILQGHSRPIKDIRFSDAGEYIYTGSNDRNVISWNINTGEKVKTYVHSAAVNIIRLTKKYNYMVTGDNTGCVYLWELHNGNLLKKIEQDPTLCVRSIDLSTDDEYIMILYAGRMKGAKSFINVYKLQEIVDYLGENDEKVKNNKSENFRNVSGLIKPISSITMDNSITIPENSKKIVPFKTFECTTKDSKYAQAKFAIMNKSLIVSREDGYLELINFSNGKIITENKFHNDFILDFDVNIDIGLILTASRDGTACVINFDTFQVLNKFHPQNPTRNLNACKIAVIQNPEYVSVGTEENLSLKNKLDLNNAKESINKSNNNTPDILKIDVENFFGDVTFNNLPKIKKDIVTAIVSGGQDSKLVTTTNQKEGGFEIITYDALEGNELCNFLTHFGPVNTLANHKNILASGAEDATVRLYKLENYVFLSDNDK
jgi:WD40 repeat protein